MITKPFFRTHFLVGIFCLGLLAGCGSPYKAVRLNPIELFENKGQNAVNSSHASLETRQLLRLMFLDKAYDKHSLQVIGILEQKVQKELLPDVQRAIAELMLLEARKVKNRIRSKLYSIL